MTEMSRVMTTTKAKVLIEDSSQGPTLERSRRDRSRFAKSSTRIKTAPLMTIITVQTTTEAQGTCLRVFRSLLGMTPMKTEVEALKTTIVPRVLMMINHMVAGSDK